MEMKKFIFTKNEKKLHRKKIKLYLYAGFVKKVRSMKLKIDDKIVKL
jgi:hypothetical protein